MSAANAASKVSNSDVSTSAVAGAASVAAVVSTGAGVAIQDDLRLKAMQVRSRNNNHKIYMKLFVYSIRTVHIRPAICYINHVNGDTH